MSTQTESTPVTQEQEQDAKSEREHVSTRQRVLAQIQRDTVARLGAGILAIMVFLTIFSIVDEFIFNRQIISTVLYDPFVGDRHARLESPSFAHPMGTDHQGRDILARVIYGTRSSMIVGVAAVSFATITGVTIGLITGYYGKAIDTIGMRAMDVILSFPAILLAIALMAVLGRGISGVIIAIAVVYTPTFARITRSEVLSKKSEEYVEAARLIGYPDRRIMVREILPNCMTPIVVQFTFSLALAIIVEAALSFVGVGLSPPTPSWGLMLSGARDYMRTAWWFSIFPGIAIVVTVLGFNLVGDSLRDALDPNNQSETEKRL